MSPARESYSAFVPVSRMMCRACTAVHDSSCGRGGRTIMMDLLLLLLLLLSRHLVPQKCFARAPWCAMMRHACPGCNHVWCPVGNAYVSVPCVPLCGPVSKCRKGIPSCPAPAPWGPVLSHAWPVHVTLSRGAPLFFVVLGACPVQEPRMPSTVSCLAEGRGDERKPGGARAKTSVDRRSGRRQRKKM